MSERDLTRTHDHDPTSSSAARDADVDPGRRARAQALSAPTSPILSGILQRKARDANGVADDAERALTSAAGSTGAALPTAIQRKFESSLGTDLSSVRVHTGADSAAAAHAVGARAYTVGQDIHFGAGEFAPSSEAGQHLLAHEVAHTVQQRGGTPTRQNKLAVSSPHDAAEHEADRAADAMVAGHAAAVASAGGGLHRAPAEPDKEPPKPEDLVASKWAISWVNKQTGATINAQSTQRTGAGDAAYGEMRVVPDTGGGSPVEVPWVNASGSGQVEVHTMPHMKNIGGEVSTSIRYGMKPSASATINIAMYGDKTKKAPADFADRKERAKNEVAEKLAAELKHNGSMEQLRQRLEAAAQAILGTPPDGMTFDVQIQLTPKLDNKNGNPKSPPEQRYAAFTATGKRKLTVVTETELKLLGGNKNSQVSTGTSHQDQKDTSSSEAHTESKEETRYTELISEMSQEFEATIKSAWKDLKQKASSSKTAVSAHAEGKLKGHVTEMAKIGGLTIDLGLIAGALAIENPALAYTLKKALGKATVDGSLYVDLEGEAGAGFAASHTSSESEYSEKLNQLDSVFHGKVSKYLRQCIVTSVTSKTTDEKRKAEARRIADGKDQRTIVGSAREVVEAEYINHDPFLTVESQ